MASNKSPMALNKSPMALNKSPLKTLVETQFRELEEMHQKPLPPRQFLTTISPLLPEGSPSRERAASAGSPARIRPVPATQGGRVVSEDPAAIAKQVEAQRSPRKLPGAEPVPPAPDAYMNELPLAPYGSTAHINLHVTETLKLALRVLLKNQSIGRQLTAQDQDLIAQIAAFYAQPAAQEPQPEEATLGNGEVAPL